MSGWATSAAPASGPSPATTLTTPAGSSGSQIRANSTTLGAANSDGFSTTVLPVASAGATFSAAEITGEFQGISAAITPSGSRTVETRIPGSSGGSVSPCSPRTRPA